MDVKKLGPTTLAVSTESPVAPVTSAVSPKRLPWEPQKKGSALMDPGWSVQADVSPDGEWASWTVSLYISGYDHESGEGAEHRAIAGLDRCARRMIEEAAAVLGGKVAWEERAKEYRRIIPARLRCEAEAAFRKHALVYHMTTTKEWMTVEQVVAEMSAYRASWPYDTTAEECDPEVVRKALEELASAGLEETQ